MRACVRACLCLRVFERVRLSASERAGDRACVRTRMRVRASVLVYLGLAFSLSRDVCPRTCLNWLNSLYLRLYSLLPPNLY